jgi:flavodoxin
LIVVESCFGNTPAVAQVIAAGLARTLGQDAVTVVRSGEAPHELPAGVDLLLVDAPTHDYSIPKEATHRQAVEKGAPGTTGSASASGSSGSHAQACAW